MELPSVLLCLLSLMAGPGRAQTSQPPCPPGYSGATPICVACTAGKFKNASGLWDCSDCHAGSFASSAKAVGCAPCRPGTYSGFAGASACVSCGAGRYSSSSGSTVCVSCGAGKFSASVAATLESACVNCAPGTYAVGGMRCESCPNFTTSPAASSAIVDCTPQDGYYARPGQKPSVCPANFYCLRGTSVATPCPDGMVSGRGASACVRNVRPVFLYDWLLGVCWVMLFGLTMICYGTYKHRILKRLREDQPVPKVIPEQMNPQKP